MRIYERYLSLVTDDSFWNSIEEFKTILIGLSGIQTVVTFKFF